MLADVFRSFAKFAVVCCVLLLLGASGTARGQEKEKAPVVRTGTNPGQWHQWKVSIIIEKAQPEGLFKGKVKILEGEDKGFEFPFLGILLEDYSVVLTRTDAAQQVSEAGPPRQRGDDYVWTGKTLDLDNKSSRDVFELRIPKK
jgi:hypothetical protein